MLPSEMGFYFKFHANHSGGYPEYYGCPGMENFQNPSVDCRRFSGDGSCDWGFVDCPKNEAPAADGLKMHEVVELYAHDQDQWVKDFHEVYEKVIQNGYDVTTLTDSPDPADLICPYQLHKLTYPKLTSFNCFTEAQLGEPFGISSVLDGHCLQLNELTGIFETDVCSAPGARRDNQKWFWAETAVGKQLVNGLMHFGVGNLYYNETSKYFQNAIGFISRDYNGEAVHYYDHFDTTAWMQPYYEWNIDPLAADVIWS